MRRFALIAALAVLGACGSDAPPRTGAAPSPASPAATSAASLPAATAQATSASTGPAVTTRATASSTGGAPPGRRVTAALDRGCARRGIDTQGLTLRNARPGGYAGYSTEYSDHSNEVTNRSYTSGFGYGRVDANGGYRATWVVPAQAPPGPAKVRVIYSASDPPIVLSFVVALQTGSC